MTAMPKEHAIAFFAAVAAHHREKWTLSDSPKFGSNALRVHGKIYAALMPGHRLLLKLPSARAGALLDGKRAKCLHGGGRVMSGWVTLAPDDEAAWIALSDEARAFVADATRRAGRARR